MRLLMIIICLVFLLGFLFLEFGSYSACTCLHEMSIRISADKPISDVEYRIYWDEEGAKEAVKSLFLDEFKSKADFDGKEIKVQIPYGTHVSMILERELTPWHTRYVVVIATHNGVRVAKIVEIPERIPFAEISFP